MRGLGLSVLVLASALLLPPSAAGAVSGWDLLGGKLITIPGGKAGTVVAFLSAKCPCSNSHVPLLKDLAKEFKEFAFVVVHSNSDETPEIATTYFKTAALPFPVIQDEKLKLAEEFRAYKTPHVFLLTPDGKIAYKGGATDSADASHAKKFYLKDALESVRAEKPVKTKEGRTLGCVIAR